MSAQTASTTLRTAETGASRAGRTETTLGSRVMEWMTTTDHKTLGKMYMVTAMLFFGFGGVLALFIRAELASPGLQFLNYETFNQFFTMHGTIMLLMFATPMFAASPTSSCRCSWVRRTWLSRA